MYVNSELIEKMQNNELVTKCWEPDCNKYKLDAQWIESGLPAEFRNYGKIPHGICPVHEKKVL